MGHGGANAPGMGHAGANAPGMGHGGANAPGMGRGGANASGMGHGAGKGPGMAQGLANALQGLAAAMARGLGIGRGGANAPGMAHGGGKGPAIGHGGTNAPGMAHGAGKGLARGGGFGFGHASVGNPTLSSHSQSQELQADSGGALNPSPTRSDPGSIVTLGFPSRQELQADRGMTLNLDTFHSDLDDIVILGAPGQELDVSRGKSLPANRQAKVALETIVPDTDDTSAIVPRDRWDLGDDLAKMLLSINPGLGVNPGLGNNVDPNAVWKLPWGIALIPLVPYFGALLLFVSGIVKSGLTGQRIRKREQRKSSAARPPAPDEFAATFLMIRAQPQKAAEEKKGPVLKQLSDDSDVEKARAQIERAREIDQTSRENFSGIGLS